jgi:hypothetical protein
MAGGLKAVKSDGLQQHQLFSVARRLRKLFVSEQVQVLWEWLRATIRSRQDAAPTEKKFDFIHLDGLFLIM